MKKMKKMIKPKNKNKAVVKIYYDVYYDVYLHFLFICYFTKIEMTEDIKSKEIYENWISNLVFTSKEKFKCSYKDWYF